MSSSAKLGEQHLAHRAAAKIQSDGQCNLEGQALTELRAQGKHRFASGNVKSQGANRDLNREGINGRGCLEVPDGA